MSDDTEERAFEREAKAPLPDGFQWLALEYRILQNQKPITKRLWVPREFEAGVDPRFDSVVRWGHALRECFHLIGAAEYIDPDRPSLFGTDKSRRLRVDIIATSAALDKWTDGSRLRCFRRAIEDEWGDYNIEGPDGAVAVLAHGKLLPTAAHMTTERVCAGIGQSDMWRGFENWKGKFCGDAEAGSFATWILAAQATKSDFQQLANLYDACGGNVATVRATMLRANAPVANQFFLVPGLIPRSALTLLLGNKKVGKSAIALELLVAVARREKEWLGFPIDTSDGGFAVYLFGEDSEGEVAERVARMTGGETPWLLHSIPDNGAGIDAILASLKSQRVAVLVVDPARKFFRGDEDGSDAVSDFFTKLETFAKAKNCAVVVLHHLKRNAAPKTLADVATHYRGSSVFLDRPRVTLAVLRSKDETHFGIPAPGGVPLHNFRASTMFAGLRRLRRDEPSFRHVSLDAPSAGKPRHSTAAAADSVLSAARGLIDAGERVTRTGKAGLFERKPRALTGMPRAAVRAAVDVLIGQGLLDSNDGGVLTLPAPASAPATTDLVG